MEGLLLTIFPFNLGGEDGGDIAGCGGERKGGERHDWIG
jgi:hypothetical protein